MKDRWLAYAPLLLLGSLAGLTYWLDQRVQPPGAGHNGSAGQPDFIVNDFNAMRMDLEGKPRYSVAAKRLIHYADETDTLLELPRLTSYEKKEAPLTIQANEGRLSPGGADAYFIGDVLLHQPAHGDEEDMSLSTSFLHIRPDQSLAKTDRDVTLKHGNSIVKSVGLEFNNATRSLKLLSRVRGTLETPRKSKPSLPWDKRR
jgi:lipopolysaccharide export system protein LptC